MNKSEETYLWLLHYYREFCEFEIPIYFGEKSLDCKILLETGFISK